MSGEIWRFRFLLSNKLLSHCTVYYEEDACSQIPNWIQKGKGCEDNTSKVVSVWINKGGGVEGVLVFFFYQNLFPGICLLLLKHVTWRRSNFWSPVGEMTSNIWASLFNCWMESKSSFFSCSSNTMPLDPWMKYLSLLRKAIFSVYWHWLGSSVGWTQELLNSYPIPDAGSVWVSASHLISVYVFPSVK